MRNTINETRIKNGEDIIDFNNMTAQTLLSFNKNTSFTYHTKQMIYNYMLIDHIWLKSINKAGTYLHNCFFRNYINSFSYSRTHKHLYEEMIEATLSVYNALSVYGLSIYNEEFCNRLPPHLNRLKKRYYKLGREFEKNIKLEALILVNT